MRPAYNRQSTKLKFFFKVRKHKKETYGTLKQDLIDLKIDMREEDIMNVPKVQWKKFVSSYIKDLALEYLIEENSTKSKTMHIKDTLSHNLYVL